MRMYKLLFFFLALFSLNSCVEYIDNGVKPEEGQTPEEKKFVAALKETTAKYVGDKFEFEAKLNGIDVTSTTKFTVNGTDIKGSHYVPFKEGSHSVVATMDNLTANFKFTVLPIEEEPEPEEGNRIEYENQSKPVTLTIWAAYGDPATGSINLYNVPDQSGATITCTKWIMVSTDNGTLDKANNLYYTEVFIPQDKTTALLYPHSAPQHALIFGMVVFNGVANVFEMKSNTYTFTSGTNPDKGSTANYTGIATLENDKDAKLFWDDKYQFTIIEDDPAKGINKLEKLGNTHNFVAPSSKVKFIKK